MIARPVQSAVRPMCFYLLLGVLLRGGAPAAFGQVSTIGSPAPAASNPAALKLSFDVASIRENERDPRGYTQRFDDPPHLGRVDLENWPAIQMVQMAYGLNFYQVTGGPDWAQSKLFTVHARSDAAISETLAKMNEKDAHAAKGQMLQALLVERFNLKVHWTTKEFPVFALVVSKGGLKFNKADPTHEKELPERCDQQGCHIAARNESISALAGILTGQTGGEVVDRTGLTGTYDFELRWSGMTSPETADHGTDPPAPPLPTALQAQLGLKLESSKAPVKVLVIDHIEMPSEN